RPLLRDARSQAEPMLRILLNAPAYAHRIALAPAEFCRCNPAVHDRAETLPPRLARISPQPARFEQVAFSRPRGLLVLSFEDPAADRCFDTFESSQIFACRMQRVARESQMDATPAGW